MRKLLVLSLIACLATTAALASPASAKKKKKKPKPRVVTAQYMTPALGAAGAGACSSADGIGCVDLGAPSGTERYVSIGIADSLPTAPYAEAGQDMDADGIVDNAVGFCGQTEAPIPIQPGLAVVVFIWEGPGATPPCPGGSSSGTVTGTFSATP